MSDYSVVSSKAFGWALDFVRAYRSRPLWARVLARFAMGKYAYRELFGLAGIIDQHGWGSGDTYELQHIDYHKESVEQL